MADLLSALLEAVSNPAVYLLLTFGYSVLVALFLPTPVELAILYPLLGRQYGLFAQAALAVAAGKTVGSWLVFRLGLRVENGIRFWSSRYEWARRGVDVLDRFVRKTGYIGLYVILSIPLMSDTIPIYLYSLFNTNGRSLQERTFLLSNFLAALNRCAILIMFYIVQVNLFGG